MSGASAPDYYATSAYRSNAIPAQPPHRWPEEAERGGVTRIPVTWGHYARLEPWQDIDSQLQPDFRPFLDNRSEEDCYLNQKEWRFENSSKLMILLPYLKYASILVGPWLWWMFSITNAANLTLNRWSESGNLSWEISFLSFIIFLFIAMTGLSFWHIGSEPPRYRRYFIQAGVAFSVALLSALVAYPAPGAVDALWLCGGMLLSIFMGFVGWDFLFDRYLRLFKHDGSGFNRQTGMVTFRRRFAGTFSAPFYEFDATLQYRPGPHGSGGYAIWLHHRYAHGELFLGGKMQSLGMELEEALAFWDTLQRYMDVTQPLPELPLLEQFRHLDPTTAEHDRQASREPRRWRDTTYRRWSRVGRAEQMKRNREYPWQQQLCILQARIDPSLTVQNYYAMQQGQGIVMLG